MSGSIEVITGPMCSGKSELLIRTFYAYQEQDKILHAYKPCRDTRDKDIVSRTGLSLPALAVTSLKIINDDNYGCIIDEAHLFDDPERQLAYVRTARDTGKTVIVSCIDVDYMGNETPFYTGICDSNPDSVHQLAARCDETDCTNDALYTALFRDGKRVLSGNPIVVDNHYNAVEIYSPRCSEHFSTPV